MLYHFYLLFRGWKKLMLFLLFPQEKGDYHFLVLINASISEQKAFFSCCLFFKRLYISLKFKKNSKPRENTELKHT